MRGVEGKAVASGDKDTVVAGGALENWNAGEALQQDHVVPYISVVVRVRRIDEAGVGGVAGAADAGRAVEGVDFEAGVVGQDEMAGGEA